MTKAIYLKEYKQIAEKLKKARLGSGLTQEEVAEKIRKPQSYISKVEQGERRIDIIKLRHFASLYKKDINYFIK